MIQQYIRPISKKIEIKNNLLDNQQGAVYLLLSIIFIAMFTVVGLAVDITNIFRYSTTLQKALDSAAVASAKVIAVIPYNEKTTNASKDKIKKAALDIISFNFLIGNQNLTCSGSAVNEFKLFDCNVDLSKLEEEESLVITASLEVPLLLLDKLPGYPEKLIVTNSAKAEVQPAIVKMMLDTSGSMASKFAQLKSSVTDFVGAFNPQRDFLGISFFSLDAQEVALMTPNPDLDKKKKGYGIFVSADINANLNVLFSNSSTNQSAALYQGFLDVQQAATPDQRTPVYILFSDGAPSAGRFFFSDVMDPPLAKNNVYGGPFTEYDYLSWFIKVDGVELPSELTRAPITRPPPINDDEYEALRFNWPFAFPPQPWEREPDVCSGTAPNIVCVQGPPKKEYDFPEVRVCPPGSTTCLPAYPQMNAPCSIVDKTALQLAFSGCMNSMAFYTPDGRVWPDLNTGAPFSNYMDNYYNSAIAMSDYIRYEGSGVLYAIGLGNPSADFSSAYQNSHDVENRKDIFFSRLANVEEYETSNPRFPSEYEFYTNPLNPTLPKYLSQGAYFPVNNLSSLPDVFRDLYNKVVRKIKVVQLMPVD